ncbi:MAG: hypothetical protein ACE37H_16110 [Phycisphaeraceae bacterium]
MPIHPPAHIDGCSLVVLTRSKGRYTIEASGILAFDGEILSIAGTNRIISEAEQDKIKDVLPDSQIKQAIGFQFFLITNE